MAAIKMAYIGGGSSRGAGTMASLIDHGDEFTGSEICLIDVDGEHLELVRTIAQRMADHADLDLSITATTDQRAGLRDVDAVLSSYRPGNFAARALDERIPIKHGLIGQETQGAGGFMMCLRSVAVMKTILADLDAVAPNSVIFNYTNPVNLVSQAVTRNSDRPFYSFCEGPLIFPATPAVEVGLDPALLQATMVGINHNCWSVEATYDGRDFIEVLAEAYEEVKDTPTRNLRARRTVEIALALGSIPADYYPFYYFSTDIVREQQRAPRTRAEQLMAEVGDYWAHYREQAESPAPVLDPNKSRGGIHELELAIDAMSAYYNDTGARLPVNLPNVDSRGARSTERALPGFDDDVVVEVFATVDRNGFHPEPVAPLPHAVRGITQQLAEYQYLAGEAAWNGDRAAAVRALVANPLVRDLPVAAAVYDELAAAHSRYLPERLLR